MEMARQINTTKTREAFIYELKNKMKKVLNSMRYASRGLWKAYTIESNLQLALVVSIVIILLGFVMELSNRDRIVILVGMGGVHSFEMMNTAIEKLCDHIHPDYHENIGIVKDVAAGASFMFIVVSLAVGAVVFSRYI